MCVAWRHTKAGVFRPQHIEDSQGSKFSVRSPYGWKASDTHTKSGCEKCNSPLHFPARSVHPASSFLLPPRLFFLTQQTQISILSFCPLITNLHGTEIRQSDGHKSEAVGVISKNISIRACRPMPPVVPFLSNDPIPFHCTMQGVPVCTSLDTAAVKGRLSGRRLSVR